jgi:hypothetical protein
MEISPKIFIGSNVDRQSKVIRKLKKNRPARGIYCICVSTNSPHLLEILDSYEIFKDIYIWKQYKLIGIANGKKEAFQLTSSILTQIYTTYGDLMKLKEFF